MTTQPKAWLSYAWKDNTGTNADDVDFLIQEITKEGVDVAYDRRSLVPGQRLWDGIAEQIQDPARTDAWIFVVTVASLASEPCREELAYALDRALSKRGAGFPMIGLILGDVPPDLPAALHVRLCVSTDDPQWARRVAAGARKQPPGASDKQISPFLASLVAYGSQHVLVVRPRMGSWAPFVFGVPIGLRDRVGFYTFAPEDVHNAGGMLTSLGEWEEAGVHWIGVSTPVITRANCAHIFLTLRADRFAVHFGQRNGPLYSVDVQA